MKIDIEQVEGEVTDISNKIMDMFRDIDPTPAVALAALTMSLAHVAVNVGVTKEDSVNHLVEAFKLLYDWNEGDNSGETLQ